MKHNNVVVVSEVELPWVSEAKGRNNLLTGSKGCFWDKYEGECGI